MKYKSKHRNNTHIYLYSVNRCLRTFGNGTRQRKKIEMREREIERALVRAVKKRNGMAFKFVSPGINGVPDRIVLLKSKKIFFVELKRPGGRMRALQEKRKAQLGELGFQVFCIDDINEIEVILDAMESS